MFVFEILKKELFRGRPHNSLKGPFREKLKIVFFREHDSKQLLLNTLIKIFIVFEIQEVKDGPVLAPKIPYYVTYVLDFDMMRSRLSRATVPLLTLITNY